MMQVIPEIVEASGRRMVRITVRDDANQVIDADVVNPLNAAQRRKVAARLAERAGDPHSAERIEQALLQMVDLIQQQEQCEQKQSLAEPAVAVGNVRVVRPELFITGEVVALSVPEVVIKGGAAVGRWRLYLRYADGRREDRELPQRLELSELEALWVHPIPPDPPVPTSSPWSDGSRRRWLEGAETVDARALFIELCRAFDDYLDLRDDGGPAPRTVLPSDVGSAMRTVLQSSSPSEGSAPRTMLHPSSPSEAVGSAPRTALLPSIPSEAVGSAPRTALQSSNPSDQTMDADDRGELSRTTDSMPTFIPSAPVAMLACWTLLSYVYPAWDAIPYLYVSGPAGSGKTRVFELLCRLVFRPIATSNLSAPALFRTLHDRGGTLLLDEAERLQEGSPEVAELRSILLAGYKRGGRATRLESVEGGGYAMTEFAVFGPKAIACIAGLPTPLLSRCIPVQMFRSPPDSRKPRRRIDQDPQRWIDLRDALHILSLERLGPSALDLAGRSELCNLSGRSYELWQPILAIASWIDPAHEWNLTARLADYAKRLIQSAAEELVADVDQTLLRVLTEMVLAGKSPTSKEVLERAKHVEEVTFRRWTPHQASAVLRRYGLEATRTNTRREYRPSVEQLKVIERNYHMDLNTAGKDRVRVTWRPY